MLDIRSSALLLGAAFFVVGTIHAYAQEIAREGQQEIVREGISPTNEILHLELPADARVSTPSPDHPQVKALLEELRRQPTETDRERPQAKVGDSNVTIVSPLWNQGPATTSYIRLHNELTIVTSRVGLFVMGANSGTPLGSNVFFNIPPRASIQISYPDILERAGLPRDMVARGSDTRFGIYMIAANVYQSYQHIIFNSVSGFFENMTACRFDDISNQGLSWANLMNIHTTGPYMTEYPSEISFHHYGTRPARYAANVYEATTGVLRNVFTFDMKGSDVMYLSARAYQGNWIPRDAESHMNIIVQRADQGAFEGLVAHYVRNDRVNGYINMTQHCWIGHNQ